MLPRPFQVFYYEKMEISDYRNDIMLAAACRGDVDKFCAQVGLLGGRTGGGGRRGSIGERREE